MKNRKSTWTRYWMILALLPLLTSCNPKPRYYEIVSQANNVLTFKIKGYTCTSPQIFIQDGTSWVEAVYPPYSPEGYFLDNQYINLGMGCDVDICVGGVGGEYTTQIDLMKYVPTGKRETPIGEFGGESYLVPSYRSVPIHGKIKITFTVYQVTIGDWDCADPTPVEFIINN